LTLQRYNQAVQDNADAVFRFLFSLTRNEMLSQDLMQDAFEKLWLARHQVQVEKVKSWLFTTANRNWIDYLRRAKKQADWETVTVHPSTTHAYSDIQEILHEALNRLPDVQKQVVLLRDYEGYSYEEIGEITNLSASQVKVYIFRARKTLKSYIGSIDRVI